MSALRLAPARAPNRESRPRLTVARLEGARGEPTLDELITGVWEGLAAHRPAACPACGGDMAPQYGAHATPIGGRCGSCQTTLN